MDKYYINIDKQDEEYGFLYIGIATWQHWTVVVDELTPGSDPLSKIEGQDIKEITRWQYHRAIDIMNEGYGQDTVVDYFIKQGVLPKGEV